MTRSAYYARASRRLALGGLVAVVGSSPVVCGQESSPKPQSAQKQAAQKQPAVQESPPEPPVPLDPAAQRRRPPNNIIIDKTLLAAEEPANQALLDKFQRLLTGAKLNGMFTVDGQPLDKLTSEQYEIDKVEKQTEGDWWLITARIKYNGKDFQVPVPAEVKWAGTTPVITLDKVTLPGYGTFSARVVFHGDRYAGTWQHDDKGGHLFGKVELAK